MIGIGRGELTRDGAGVGGIGGSKRGRRGCGFAYGYIHGVDRVGDG